MSLEPLEQPVGGRVHAVLYAVAGVGGALFLIGLLVDPTRAWGGYLIGFHYVSGLALAGALFTAVLALSGARWAGSAALVPRWMARRLPLAAALGAFLLLGIPSLYEWSHAAVVEGDPLLQHKRAWLNPPAFALRMLLYFAAWILASRLLVRRSADAGTGRGALLRAASLFMLVFAIGFSLASVDWLESLDPHWFSTIFALYTLAGLGVSGIGCAIVLVIVLRRAGVLRVERYADLLDDLGKIALGLALFWVYIWYCQYMLTWYTNMPEETGWFLDRMRGPWRVLTPVNLALNWAVPFFALMPRALRRSEQALLRVACVMLVGHAIDLYVIVGPSLHAQDPMIGPWELAPLVAAVALFSAQAAWVRREVVS
jgi:hypothetical protein